MAWGGKEESTTTSTIIELREGNYLPRHIQELTGIRDSDMAAAVPLESVFANFHDFLKTSESPLCYGIIHFAQFEKPFIEDAYNILKEAVPFSVLCTHEIAKRLFPNLPTRGIKGLAGYYGYPVEELKRSKCHVDATRVIWNGLLNDLKEKDIYTLEDLQKWLAETPKKARTKYEYPLPKEKRLTLTKKPGIYRMISKTGEVLYVGKATSLRDRVNSYFRGQKNRDPKKLEMLTQVWDLIVTPCESPLEAALMETDEIKRLNPRYNISLKTGNRGMVFYTQTLDEMSIIQDTEHPIGPFSNPWVLDSVSKLSRSLTSIPAEMNRYMFFDPIDPQLIEEGLNVFCSRYDVDKSKFSNMRSIIALGLWWYRDTLKKTNLASEILETESANEDEVILEDDSIPESEFSSEEEILELTAEDLADKFERHFIRAGRAYWRAREMTKLLNSDIDFQMIPSDKHGSLIIRKGKLSPTMNLESDNKMPWEGLSIEDYDRMTVLNSELAKIRSQNGQVHVKEIHSGHKKL
ncbi:MAG: GIY-YIG nuclease family protein [Bdellovibrionota bacterium]